MARSVKMDLDLGTNPLISQMASKLGMGLPCVLGLFYQLCVLFTRHTGKDGLLRGATLEWLDTTLGRPTFTNSLVELGFLEVLPTGLKLHQDGHAPSPVQEPVPSPPAPVPSAEPVTPPLVQESPPPDQQEVQEPEVTTGPARDLFTPPKPKKTPPDDPAWDQFWAAYPRKTAKIDARKAWDKLSPDADTLKVILEALEAQKKSPQWTKEGGQFIPHPATWLNAKRWEDEIVTPVSEEEAWEQKRKAEWDRNFKKAQEFAARIGLNGHSTTQQSSP